MTSTTPEPGLTITDRPSCVPTTLVRVCARSRQKSLSVAVVIRLLGVPLAEDDELPDPPTGCAAVVLVPVAPPVGLPEIELDVTRRSDCP